MVLGTPVNSVYFCRHLKQAHGAVRHKLGCVLHTLELHGREMEMLVGNGNCAMYGIIES